MGSCWGDELGEGALSASSFLVEVGRIWGGC